MLLAHLFRALLSPRSSERRRPARRFLPTLEGLEDRAVPAILTVTTDADSGAGSLRQKISAAASGDSIIFAPALAGHTITLTTGELDITKNLQIAGLGALKLAVSGNDASRVFHVESGNTLKVSDLSIVHGMADTGGAIDNAGTLNARNLVVAKSQSVGGMGGGAILNEGRAVLTLDGSQISGNQAQAAPNTDVVGGGLLNLGQATITTTTFRQNAALGGAGSFFGGSDGGGLDNFGGATLKLTSCVFVGNRAIGAGGFFGGAGGALDNNAGFQGNTPSTATIINCQFLGNAVTGPVGTFNDGGAIMNQTSPMTITGSSFVGNQAIGGSGGSATVGYGEGLGGAIFNYFNGNIIITFSSFVNNQARGGDGGTNANANPPIGSGQGGAIVNGGATLTIALTEFAGNQALGGNSTLGPGGLAEGGAIANWGPTLYGSPGVLTVRSSGFVGNQALGGRGGASPFGSPLPVPGGLAFGGAIDDSFSGTATITGSTLRGNSATGGVSSDGNPGGTAYGGGISVGFSTQLGMADNAMLQLNSCIVALNLATGGTGGLGANGGDGLGGGVAIFPGSTAKATLSFITLNLAAGGAAGAGGSDGKGIGGGVYNLGTFSPDVWTSIHLVGNHATTSNDNIFP